MWYSCLQVFYNELQNSSTRCVFFTLEHHLTATLLIRSPCYYSPSTLARTKAQLVNFLFKEPHGHSVDTAIFCGLLLTGLMGFHFILQAQEMGASGTMIGLIFGIYPLVVFVVAPLIGVLVSLMFGCNYALGLCTWLILWRYIQEKV